MCSTTRLARRYAHFSSTCLICRHLYHKVRVDELELRLVFHTEIDVNGRVGPDPFLKTIPAAPCRAGGGRRAQTDLAVAIGEALKRPRCSPSAFSGVYE